MIQNSRSKLSNGKIDKGGVDAMVTVNEVTVGIEIETGNYGRDEITEKIETAQALGCERMPVILPADIEKVWLDNTITDTLMLKDILKPYDGDINFKAVV